MTGSETGRVEEGLHLHSASLLSKWGFNDGDEPDVVMDLLDEHGVDWRGMDWHWVLRGLVRDYLVPALDQRVVVYDIETAHNPIRAESVDGMPVDDYAGDAGNPAVSPESVTVPWDVVLQRCREAPSWGATVDDEPVTHSPD